MRCVTAQLSDPLHVWKSIKELWGCVCAFAAVFAVNPLWHCLSAAELSSAQFPTGLYASTATQTEMRGRRRRTPLSYKQTRAQSGSWESAMREQVSLFTCGSHGGLKAKYPHLFFVFNPPGSVLLGLFTWRGGGKTASSVLSLNHHKRPLYENYLKLSPLQQTPLK